MLFKLYVVEDAVCNFINNTVRESKCCSEVMKKQFNENLVITKNDHEDFKNSNKCWICKKTYVEGDVKVRDHCHITAKYGDSAHSNCSIKVKSKFLSILK